MDRMKRRGFLGLLGAAIAAPFVSRPLPTYGVDLATGRDVTAFVVTHNQADAVFLSAKRWNRDDVARAFNVPAHLIGPA